MNKTPGASIATARQQRTAGTTKLTKEQRDKLPESKFALPGHRYPIEDEAHAENAKARAAQQAKAGKLSKREEKLVDSKADEVLRKG